VPIHAINDFGGHAGITSGPADGDTTLHEPGGGSVPKHVRDDFAVLGSETGKLNSMSKCGN
jgi:hypothetical protein